MALSFEEIKKKAENTNTDGSLTFEQIKEKAGIAAADKTKDYVFEEFQNAADKRNQAIGKKIADSVSGNSLLEFPFAAISGLGNFAEGLNGITQQRPQPLSSVQYASSYIRENMSSPVKRALYDLTSSAANMAPTIAFNAATGGGGALLTGVSSGGNAKAQALRDGYSNEEALLYGAVNGALEGGLQYALGGIKSIGGNGLSKLASKTPVIKAIGKAAQSVIKNPVIKNALKVSGKYIANMGDEAFEEYLQSVLDPVVRNIVLKEDNEIDLLSEDALYSALLGAMSAGILNLPGAIGDVRSGSISTVSANNVVENIQQDQNAEEVSPADTGKSGSAFFDAGSNIDTIVRDVLGKNESRYVQADLSPEAKSARASVVRETGAALNVDADIVDIVAKVAENTGRNIQFVETLGGKDGKYDRNTGTLYIAADSKYPVKFLVKHELTHSLEGTKAYEELSDFVLTEFIRKDAESKGLSVDDFIETKIKQYAESGETLTQEGAMKELVADYCAARLFTNEKAIRQLSASKPGVARRLLNWIRSLKTKLLGTKMEKTLARAEKLYHDALMTPYRTGSGTQYSIESLPGGHQYVKADREVIHGENPDEWRKQVQNYINDSIRNGKDVVVYGADGDALTITGDTAGKARFRNEITLPDGSKRPMTDSEFAVKLRAESHIDELAQASTRGKYDVPDFKNHPFAKDGFNYRTAYFMDNDGSYYRLTLSVGKKGEVNTVYNVGKIKEAKLPLVAQRPTRTNTGPGSETSDFTVPQSTDTVNTSISNFNADDAQSAIGFLGEDTAEEMMRLVEKYRSKADNPVEIGKLTSMDADTTPPVSGGARDNGNGYTVPEESSTNGDSGSHFVENIGKSSIFDDTFKQMSLDDAGVSTYDSITNKSTLESANKQLNDGGYKAVIDWFSKPISQATPEDIATGVILLGRYQKIGDYEGMVNVARRLRKFGTSAGQTVQEFSILGRMTPEGMAYYAQKSLDEAFESMVKNRSQNWINKNADKFKLTEEDIRFVMERTQEASKLPEGRDKNILLGEVAARIQNKIPPEKGQNIRALARISMLLNPKTNVRNVLGNVSITPISWIDDLIGTAVDKAISSKTGQRTTGLFDPKSVKGLGKGVYESFDDFRRKINTRDIDADRFEIGQGGKSFNENHTGVASVLNPLSKALNALDRTTSFLLDAGDRGFFEMWFMNSLNNQMKLNDVKTPTPEMIEVARQDALTRTWQDTNGYTKFVSGVKKALNSVNVGGYGLGDVFVKFTKTPANLTKALVDYSPVGLTRAIASDGRKFYQAVSRGQATPKLQRTFVNSLSKGITGTMLMIIFAALADNGILKGKSDSDEDVAEFEKNVLGIQPYSVKIGDKYYSYEWMQPIGGSAAIVSDIVQQMNGQKPTQYFKGGTEAEDMANAILSAIQSGGQVLYDQSFMQSLANLFESDSMMQGLLDGILSEPSVFVPQVLSQTSQLFDDTARRSYVSGRPLETAENKILYKTPWRTNLEPVVDVLGREVAGKNNVWDAYFNPANTSMANTTAASEEMYRVYQATMDKNVIPPKAPISLSAKDKTLYQKTTGVIASNEVDRLLSNEQYKQLADEDKAELLKNIYSYANAVAKSAVSDYVLNEENEKIKQAEDSGVSVADYLILSLQKDADGNRYVTQKEMKAALDQTDFTNSQKALLWNLQNKSWKNNPYGSKTGTSSEETDIDRLWREAMS